MEALCRSPSTTSASQREKALFSFLEKVNDNPAEVRREDVASACSAGLSEDELFEAITVCAAFNFFNRWVSATGVRALPEGFWEGFLTTQGGLGYATEGGPASPPGGSPARARRGRNRPRERSPAPAAP